MDIMQVLQDICKNPEAHDKGTNITHHASIVCYLAILGFHICNR